MVKGLKLEGRSLGIPHIFLNFLKENITLLQRNKKMKKLI
jgi:hypothetical protein